MSKNEEDYFGGLSDSDGENLGDIKPEIDKLGLTMSEDDEPENQEGEDDKLPREAVPQDSAKTPIFEKLITVKQELLSNVSMAAANKSEPLAGTLPCPESSPFRETPFKRRAEQLIARLENSPKRRKLIRRSEAGAPPGVPRNPTEKKPAPVPETINQKQLDQPKENDEPKKSKLSVPPTVHSLPSAECSSSSQSDNPPALSEYTIDPVFPKSEYELKKLVMLANMSKEQFDRYEAYRSSSFSKAAVTNLIKKATGKAPSNNVILTVRTLAKVFVGEIVEEALDLREKLNKESAPLQPEHIKSAFMDLVRKKKLWPPYGHK